MAEPTSANRAPSLIIAAGAGLAIGLATGLLLRPVSADWFEAVGTWVGVVVSTTAVLLAVVIFRSEDFMRRMDQARALESEEERFRATREAEQQLADLVIVKCEFGGGHSYPEGRLVASEVRHYVQNSSTEPIAQLDYRHPLYQPDFQRIVDTLAPNEGTGMVSVTVPNLEATRERLADEAEIRFRLRGSIWRKRGEESALRDLS